MAILRITTSFENYKEFETDLEFSVNGKPEKLYVVLYKQKVAVAGLANRIEKKSKVVFLLPNNEEVSKRAWTKEMKTAAAEYAKQFPVLDYGKKLTLFGKVFYSIFVLGILFGGIYLFYLISIKSPGMKEKNANFSTIPAIGDKYYGSFSKSPTKNTAYFSTHSWIKITAINTTDSICSYKLSTKPGEYTFNTLEEEHSNFSTEELQGKFTFDEKSKKVIINSADKNVRFEVMVINNEYEKYKISEK